MKRIFLSCCEASGDNIAASLVPYLRAQFGEECALFGITGELMQQAGVQSWISIDQFNVMGLGQVLINAPRLLASVARLARRLDEEAPDIVLCIDAPDFHIRLIERMRNTTPFRVQMVSPSIWAWRANRAKRFANAFDALYCIFPFEPQYYAGLPIQAVYVGHPSRTKVEAEIAQNQITHQSFRQRFGHAQSVCLLPGSRPQELKSLKQDFQSITRLLCEMGDYQFIIPTFEKYRRQLEGWWPENTPTNIITSPPWRYAAMRYADVALNCLGTAEIELTLRQTPHVAIYRFGGIDNYLRRLFTFHIKHAATSNIILDRLAITEYLHHDIDHQKIAENLHDLAQQKGAWQTQQQAMKEVFDALAPPDGQKHHGETLVQHLAANCCHKQRF